MNIRNIINTYTQKGYKFKDAQNLAAEEIIIKKIASSDMVEHVAFKGGIVMFNLTKNNRRVTQDIDFDLIRYSIDKESISMFINKMNRIDDGFNVFIHGDIEDLHQEDYHGVRVHIIIRDKNNNTVRTKLDIGVHTYSAIEQDNVIFSFDSNEEGISIKVNPKEQIVAEKLIALARLGKLSKRYKDLYDVYYLINECDISKKKVSEILSLFFINSKRKPNNLLDFINTIEDTLND